MNHRKELTNYVSKRENTFGFIDPIRIQTINSFFTSGRGGHELDEYAEFLLWLREIQENLSFVLVWGSYVKGLNSRQSYSRLKDDEHNAGVLKCGKSDFDALIITQREIRKPESYSKYQVLDARLDAIATVHLDTYRDVFVVNEFEFDDFIHDLKENHLALYAFSCMNDGVVLKDKGNYTVTIERLGEKVGYEQIALTYFSQKYDLLKLFL